LTPTFSGLVLPSPRLAKSSDRLVLEHSKRQNRQSGKLRKSKNSEIENSKIAKIDRGNFLKIERRSRAHSGSLSPSGAANPDAQTVQSPYRPRLAVGFRHPAGIVHTQR
jgi:hypothetical protein